MEHPHASKKIINLIPLFADLSEQNKELLKNALVERTVRKGTVLFVEHDPADAIYFLRKGKVRLTKSTPDGKELILHIRKPGDLFAEVALFRKTIYPATAEMIEDGEVVIIRNQDLEQIIMRYPEIGISIIQIMGERLHQAQSKLRDVTLYGKLGALSASLVRLAEEYGVKTEEGIAIQLTLTHQELANFIGAARENVNRMMSTLEKNGILTMKRGEIVIKDLEELKNYIN
ncbi:MAG: Crp/Fnr family transcriptional regulator [Tepidibacillus sp.]|uniref:Crp/Fnr family transcriptional regulator n=1 Tax=Tepidibacillus sp. HK-1 TaxID=1883407 RepID=UPI0008539918|nr:Crp/Fnr family transcriptional regulator [Tepidibacillus sp. HK-1]GBF11171.1 anaerobic regulatory protein [Tepidibacillus sp. HK-1]